MKKILTILISLLLVSLVSINIYANDQKVIDTTNVLSENEEAELYENIENYIKETNFDIVVYYVNNSEYYQKYNDAITRLADDTYDLNGYGIGEDNNGLIMCVDVYQRDFTITTCGSECIDTYTDYALDNMYEVIKPYLSDDNWFGASMVFVDSALEVYEKYDYYHQEANIAYGERSALEDSLIPSFGFAAIVTLVVFLILRGQLKNANVKTEAFDYMKDHNINVFRSGEIYLYTTRTRQKIQKSQSNSSGSSTHMSSSNVSHGGGGSHKF